MQGKMAKKGPSIHVVPSATKPGQFVAKEARNPKPVTRPASQAETIKKAIPLARHNQSEVVTPPPPRRVDPGPRQLRERSQPPDG